MITYNKILTRKIINRERHIHLLDRTTENLQELYRCRFFCGRVSIGKKGKSKSSSCDYRCYWCMRARKSHFTNKISQWKIRFSNVRLLGNNARPTFTMEQTQHIATHRRSHRNPSRRYVPCTMARAENHENDKFSSWDVVTFRTYRDLVVDLCCLMCHRCLNGGIRACKSLWMTVKLNRTNEYFKSFGKKYVFHIYSLLYSLVFIILIYIII